MLATEEVLGVADARMRWLGGELEAAKTSPKKKEEIADLSDQVTKTAADLAQVNTAALELMHEKARLQRVGALLKAPYEQVLSTGYRVKAATSGIEAHLIAFIQDPKKKVDKTTWFDFDRLVFIAESADIDFPNSRSQLENVVEILKAYPAVKLKIGAYTDAGPAARNKKLSTDRAQMVRTALIQMGVDAEAARRGRVRGRAPGLSGERLGVLPRPEPADRRAGDGEVMLAGRCAAIALEAAEQRQPAAASGGPAHEGGAAGRGRLAIVAGGIVAGQQHDGADDGGGHADAAHDVADGDPGVGVGDALVGVGEEGGAHRRIDLLRLVAHAAASADERP